MDIRRKLILATALALGGTVFAAEPPPLSVDDGQYRSKVRILGAGDLPQSEIERDQINAPGTSLYARALALRHFAYAAIAQGDTNQAIADLEAALATGGLADAAADEMRFNLGPLYFAAGRYAEAESMLAARSSTVPEPEIDVMLAAARVELGKTDAAMQPLARALNATPDAPVEWIELALYIATERREFTRAEQYAAQLIDRDPMDADAWHRLVDVTRQAGAPNKALAALIVMREAGLATPADWPLMFWAYRAAGLPYEGARFAESRIETGELPADSETFRTVAESWLAAGERHRAYMPMLRAAETSGDRSLYFRAGELAVQLERFDDARGALEKALSGKTLVANRSDALMLLGFAHYRLGNTRAARSTFKDATELGVNYRAAQGWLDFIDQQSPPQVVARTEPATSTETKTVRSAPIVTKSVPRTHFFFTSLESEPDRAIADALPRIRRLVNETRRERLTWNGPLHLIMLRNPAGADPVTVQVAAPVRTKVTGTRGYRSRTSAQFECAWREFEGSAETLSDAWQRFAEDFAAAGLEGSGEVRFVIHDFDRNQQTGRFEMQIGLANGG